MQLIVQMKNLRLDPREVEEFLREKISSSIETHKTELRIQDAKARDVKLLLHKFLHQRGRDSYRVEVVHPGLVEVFGPERPKPHFVRETGSPPSAGATMPFLFPSSPALAGSPVKRRKKPRN